MDYPTPGRAGFHDFIAPGRVGSGGADRLGEFSLTVERTNTTGWRALRRRLLSTGAHILLAQETGVSQSPMPAAAEWAKKRGWKSVWAPALTTEAGGTSAGVAIFARDHLGLRFPDVGSHIWHPGRAVAAILEAPGHRPTVVASCYLVSGCGAGRENLEILSDAG